MRLYCLFIAVSSSDVPSLLLRKSEVLLFFYCTHMHNIAFLAYPFLSVFPIYIWCVLENFPHQLKTCPKKNANFYCWCAFCTLMSVLTEGLKRFLFPISQPKFSPNPIFLVTALFKIFFFFADESQSHCIESNFPYQKISTFQFPFYLFRILSKWNKKWMTNRNCLLSCQLKHVMFTLSLPYISYIESNNGPPQEQYST